MTTNKLQQAAAALGIPWSEELEQAVLTQVRTPPVIPPLVIPSISHSESPRSLSNVTNVNARTSIKHSRLVEENESDEILAKRAKNTNAARRSRFKKVVKLEGLEAKVAEMEATNHRLNTRVAILETEKNGFLIKEAEQNARIAQLEAKVMEARLALNTRSQS
jgi:hypothetical protein